MLRHSTREELSSLKIEDAEDWRNQAVVEAEEDTVEKKSEDKFGRRLKKPEDVRAAGVRRVH